MTGYLGLRDEPACIFSSTSAERVSWLCDPIQQGSYRSSQPISRDSQDIGPDLGSGGLDALDDLFGQLANVAVGRVEDDGNDGLGGPGIGESVEFRSGILQRGRNAYMVVQGRCCVILL